MAHAAIVRAFPVELIASLADVKLVEVLLCFWQQAMKHRTLADDMQNSVAVHTSSKWHDQADEVKAPHNLNYLLAGNCRPNPVAVGHHIAF